MKKLLLLSFFSGAMLTAQAQEVKLNLKNGPCGFDKVLKKENMSGAKYIHDVMQPAQEANRQQTAITQLQRTTGTVYDIPVVVHIVYRAQNVAYNIPDSVVTNQIDILTKAYRKTHADTGNVRALFKPLSGDAEIQFHLATTDPQGNPTTGITRTATTRAYFGSADGSLDSLERVKHTATGGIDAWPTDHYLNIWVCNMSDSAGQLNVLGYAVPPRNPVPSNWPAGTDQALAGLQDGVVLQVHSVGDNSVLNPQLQGIYSKGRCAVHEVGHYLGLMHVFGSNDGTTQDCTVVADDGIGDTPTQALYSFDNNSGVSCPPATKNSCGAGTAGDLPDMWEDYMDYTRDACQALFTNDQIAVMRGVLVNQRATLFGSTPAAVTNVTKQSRVGIYPNPANNTLHLDYAGTIQTISIRSMIGQEVLHLSGNSVATKSYDISALPTGNYILQVQAQDGSVAVDKFTVIR